MRKTGLYLSLLLMNLVSAQENTEYNQQRVYFEKAEKHLKNSEIFQALKLYHFISNSDLKTEIQISSKQKFDSLFPFCQKTQTENAIRRWKGTWELKQLRNNDPSYKYLIFNEREIKFYANNLQDEPDKIENINFASSSELPSELHLTLLLFANSELWSFHIESDREERLLQYRKRDASGEIYLMVDDRGIMRDKKEREEAYKNEIYTYYVRK